MVRALIADAENNPSPTPTAADALREAAPLPKPFGIIRLYQNGKPADYVSDDEQASEMWAYGMEDVYTEQQMRDYALAGHASRDAEIAGLKEERTSALAAVDSEHAAWVNVSAHVQRLQEERRAIKYAVVDTVGGVDYEGSPTTELNYLQRLQILVEAEKERDALRAEVETLRKEKLAALQAHAELLEFIPAFDNETACKDLESMRSECQSLTAQLAEAKAEDNDRGDAVDGITLLKREIERLKTENTILNETMQNWCDCAMKRGVERDEARATLTAAQTLAGELAGALEAAPHSATCGFIERSVGVEVKTSWTCTCWKSQALARYRAQQRPTVKEAE